MHENKLCCISGMLHALYHIRQEKGENTERILCFDQNQLWFSGVFFSLVCLEFKNK